MLSNQASSLRSNRSGAMRPSIDEVAQHQILLLAIRRQGLTRKEKISSILTSANMASMMPILAPPRTPTPPSDENSPQGGLGLDGIPYASTSEVLYDPNSLSPADPDAHFGSMSANMISPASGSSGYRAMSVDSGKSDASSPFNFQTTTLAKTPVIKSVRPLERSPSF